MEGETCLVCERPAVVNAIQNKRTEESSNKSICLVTGQEDTPAILHTAIKGVWGAQTSGANIVSFNLGAFTSYGKMQGNNAPVGMKTEFAIYDGSEHAAKKGINATAASRRCQYSLLVRKKHKLEDVFAEIFGEPAKDDQAQDIKALIAALRAPQIGAKPELDPKTRFYVLGLAPNAARIAVRFWYEDTVQQVLDHIDRHFEDCTIVHGPNQPDTLSLFRLLVSTAVQGKSENIQPNLAGDMMRSILSGTPYPKSLLSSAIRRIRAEHEITYPRAALVKAVLTRETQILSFKSKGGRHVIGYQLTII